MTAPDGDLLARRDRIASELVGRERELELILAAVAAGRDLLLEGPPGTSKSTILRGITKAWQIPFVLVEGNAELTPAKLVGHHNPARVLKEDYSAENFVPGPLVQAMQAGGFLYIEEFNRTPEDTLNALLMAMAEREVVVPRVGRIVAEASFRLIAAMNPFDNVGTTRISGSIHDRMCRLSIAYQTAEEEVEIVALRSGVPDRRLARDAVALARASRTHPDVRLGSSVRGAIDLVLIAAQLGRLRGQPASERARAQLVLDAALLALSGRLALHETSEATAEQIVVELWQDYFHLDPSRALAGDLTLRGANPAVHRSSGAAATPSTRARRPLSRKPKPLDTAPTLYRTGAGGFVIAGGDSRGRGDADLVLAPGTGTQFTGERGDRRDLDALLEEGPLDREVQAMVQRITRALAVRRRAANDRMRRGQGQIVTLRYRYNSDDIDLDRTLEMLTERPLPEDTDIFVRERSAIRRAVALIGDVSGSMRGEKARITAATIGALCADLTDDELAVVAFWKHAALIQPMAQGVAAERVLRCLLRLPAKGLTNIHFGLETALAELERAKARRRIAILLSDAVHNAGPDPRDVAARFERLHVLLEVDGEHDEDLAFELARAGKGRIWPVRDHTAVPGALNELLAA